MNRVGLKDYLLNEASDYDLLDCAKAYDAANQYGHFDTYDSVEEAAKLCGWDVETALSESHHVESNADCYRFNGYGHLEAVSNESLLEDARDDIDNIIDWLEGASRYELMDVSSDVELFVDAKDPFEIIKDVDCSVREAGDAIEVDLSRGDKKATLSFSKLNDIDVDKIDLANAAYATADSYYRYAKGASTEEVQTAFFKENGRRLSDARADDLTEACEKNMDALGQVLEDSEIEALTNFYDVEICSETYCATLANEARECKYIASALEKMGFDVENGRAIEKHAELAPKQRTVFDQMVGDDYCEVHEQLGKFFGTGRVNQSEKPTIAGEIPSSSRAPAVRLPSGTAPTMSTLAAWLCSCPAATSSARSPSPSFSKRWQIVSASNPRNVPHSPIGRGRRNASARAYRIFKSRSIAPTTITSSKER